MSPYETIYRAYHQHRPEVDFGKLCGYYLQYGFVFSTPDFFVLGNRSRKDGLDGPPDCWHIQAFAGDMTKLWRVFSVLEPMPWVAFTRLSDASQALTFVELSRLKRLCPPDLSSLDALQSESILAKT